MKFIFLSVPAKLIHYLLTTAFPDLIIRLTRKYFCHWPYLKISWQTRCSVYAPLFLPLFVLLFALLLFAPTYCARFCNSEHNTEQGTNYQKAQSNSNTSSVHRESVFYCFSVELFSFPVVSCISTATIEHGKVGCDTNVNMDGTERTNNNHEFIIKFECNY